MITKFTELLMCGHWEPKAAPCAIVVHFVNFIIIGFWLRITNNYLLLVYRLQNLKIRLKKMNIVIVILCVCVRNK